MNGMHQTVDKMYAALRIQNEGKVPRKTLNVGTMTRSLNTNYSAVAGNKGNVVWSNNTKT